jgi:hypothetical protein
VAVGPGQLPPAAATAETEEQGLRRTAAPASNATELRGGCAGYDGGGGGNRGGRGHGGGAVYLFAGESIQIDGAINASGGGGFGAGSGQDGGGGGGSGGLIAFDTQSYRSNLELHFWRYGTTPSARRIAEVLGDYGCRPEDVDVAVNPEALNAGVRGKDRSTRTVPARNLRRDRHRRQAGLDGGGGARQRRRRDLVFRRRRRKRPRLAACEMT